MPHSFEKHLGPLRDAVNPLSPTIPLLQDWQIAKNKQDQHLDNIEKGLSTLKGIGESMGEALKTQDVLLDTIDEKVSGKCLMSLRRAA